MRFCRRLRSDSIRPGALKLTATFKSGRADDRRSTRWSMHRGNPHDRNPGCARPPNIKQALHFLQPIGLDVGAQQGELLESRRDQSERGQAVDVVGARLRRMPCRARRPARRPALSNRRRKKGRQPASPLPRTGSSNPFPSSGESGANLSLARIRLPPSRSCDFPRVCGLG